MASHTRPQPSPLRPAITSRRSMQPFWWIFFAIGLILTPATSPPVLAQGASNSVRVGPRVQKNAGVLTGFEVTYANEALLGGHPRFSLAFLTSRPRSVIGSNGLLEDRILLGAGWSFRPGKRIEPYLQLEVGYTRFDREDSELFALLDNDAMIGSLLVGIEARLFESRFSVVGDAGYSMLHSSTVYPFVTSLGIQYSLQPRTKR